MLHGIPFWGFLSESGHGESLGEGLEVVMRVGFPKPPHSPPRVPQITQTQIRSEIFRARFSKGTRRIREILLPLGPGGSECVCVGGVTLPAPRGAGAGTAKGELADRRCRGLRPAGVAAGTWDPGQDLGGPSEAADRSWGRWALPVPLRDFLRIRNLHAIPQLRRTKGALQGGRTPGPPRVPLQGP